MPEHDGEDHAAALQRLRRPLKISQAQSGDSASWAEGMTFKGVVLIVTVALSAS